MTVREKVMKKKRKGRKYSSEWTSWTNHYTKDYRGERRLPRKRRSIAYYSNTRNYSGSICGNKNSIR